MRWTAKIKQLTEQYKDVDVDEYKRIKEEKKQFQQQISSLKTDNQRIRTQTESLKSDLSKTQGELAGLRVKFHCTISAKYGIFRYHRIIYGLNPQTLKSD